MLIESALHLRVGLAMFQDIVNAPEASEIVRVFLRWSHFVAGIAWIGLLYFFNLVNVNFMKALDAPTKKVVIPALMPRALWYFRWGAVVTVLVGLMYYAMYILAPDVRNANALGNASANTWLILLVWLLIPVITWAIYYFLLPRVSKDGRVLAAVVTVLVLLMAAAVLYWLNSQLMGGGARADSYASNKTLSIGVGGALGVIMLLNVWGIIWRAQKRIIAGTISGEAAPPELARQAFLASRTNAWLSLPMLFLMATSHGDYIMFGKS